MNKTLLSKDARFLPISGEQGVAIFAKKELVEIEGPSFKCAVMRYSARLQAVENGKAFGRYRKYRTFFSNKALNGFVRHELNKFSKKN